MKRWIKISLWSIVGAFGLFMTLGFTLVALGVKPTSTTTAAHPTSAVTTADPPPLSSAQPTPTTPPPAPVVAPAPVAAPVVHPPPAPIVAAAPSPAPAPTPARARAPAPAPASAPAPATDGVRICKITPGDGGVYYLHIASAQAHDFSACGDGHEAFNSNLDTLFAQPGMDRRCFVPQTTEASIAVYSSTGKGLADAQRYCDSVGGKN